MVDDEVFWWRRERVYGGAECSSGPISTGSRRVLEIEISSRESLLGVIESFWKMIRICFLYQAPLFTVASYVKKVGAKRSVIT